MEIGLIRCSTSTTAVIDVWTDLVTKIEWADVVTSLPSGCTLNTGGNSDEVTFADDSGIWEISWRFQCEDMTAGLQLYEETVGFVGNYAVANDEANGNGAWTFNSASSNGKTFSLRFSGYDDGAAGDGVFEDTLMMQIFKIG